MGKNSIYLGNNLVFGSNCSKDFRHLKDKIQSKNGVWQRNLLSRAGKATFIKAVVQAVPTYSMSTFRVFKGVCRTMDAMVRNFWWGARDDTRFLALKSCKNIYQPREFGGLGFRLFKNINTALLSKLGWVLASGHRRLWTNI